MTKTNRYWSSRMGWIGLLGMVLVSVAGADEEKLPLAQLPGAVRQAVQDRFPRGKLLAAAKEVEKGKIAYEVTLQLAGQPIEVLVTPDGKITTIERTIAVEDLPRPITAAVAARYPGKQIAKVEEVIRVAADGREILEYYEIVVSLAAGQNAEVHILPGGRWKSADKEKK
jgi:hypothetical protein